MGLVLLLRWGRGRMWERSERDTVKYGRARIRGDGYKSMYMLPGSEWATVIEDGDDRTTVLARLRYPRSFP